jgi:Oxidoreductase FAD-binding domain/2Fe-2S iron-sulfur cluster binding domain
MRQEIWLPHACRGGTCGSCRAIVVDRALTYDRGLPVGMRQVASRTEAFLCCAKPLGDITLNVAELGARPIGSIFRRPARVVEISKPSRDVAVVTLKPPPTAVIRFRSGQYICAVGEDGRRHPFSIANTPRADGTLELHVERIPNGRFTSYVHVQLRRRDIVRFVGPFGEFGFCDAVECSTILFAGGTGIAPIKAMLESLIHTGKKRELHLSRGPESEARGSRADGSLQTKYRRDRRRRTRTHTPVAARLRCGSCFRCSMTSIDQKIGTPGLDVLPVLSTYRYDDAAKGVKFGAYAAVSSGIGSHLRVNTDLDVDWNF